MGTTPDSTAALEYANNALWTAPYGALKPTGPFPAVFPQYWSHFGHLSSEGVTTARDVQNQREFSSTGALVKEMWSQLYESHTIICDESNPVVENLKSPNSVQTVVTPAVAEVQTVTITGTPTGGSFTPIYNGYIASSTVAYNGTGASLQTALQTIPALAGATVSGSASGPYTVTIPGLGDASLLTFSNQLTGGTNPAVTSAETTKGTLPVYQWIETSSGLTTPNLRLFAFDQIAGNRATRTVFAGVATATDLGTTAKGSLGKTTFQVAKYEDVGIGGLNLKLSTNPAFQPGAFV